jgi:hypothetical protein
MFVASFKSRAGIGLAIPGQRTVRTGMPFGMPIKVLLVDLTNCVMQRKYRMGIKEGDHLPSSPAIDLASTNEERENK